MLSGTCRRNTILLASCISLSSCSWWASSCSSHDFSSSGASCPRAGHKPQRDPSERYNNRETGVGWAWELFLFVIHGIVQILLDKNWCAANLYQISSLSAVICHPEAPPGVQIERWQMLLSRCWWSGRLCTLLWGSAQGWLSWGWNRWRAKTEASEIAFLVPNKWKCPQKNLVSEKGSQQINHL